MLSKTLTSRDFLKTCSSELLNPTLSLNPEARWQQALSARSMRNFWFTATGKPNPISGGTATLGAKILAQTQRFAEPIIITDVLSMFDYKLASPTQSAMMSRYLLELTRFGSGDASSGVNLFGLAGPVGPEFITKHEKNYSEIVTINTGGAGLDTQAKWLPFVPRLLKPYDFIQAQWFFNPLLLQDTSLEGWYPQIGLRSVRVFPIDSPYRYINTGPEKQIKDYIAGNRPETFFLEIRFPLASIPFSGQQLTVKTPQMGRPLLVLGATSNLEGVQAALFEEESYYNFTSFDTRPAVSKVPTMTYVPLSLWAANSDFRNTNIYNMWPVPHLLQPGAQLTVSIVNGLLGFFDPAGGFFQDIAKTRSDQDARITFVCRTV